VKPLAIDLYCGLGGWAEGFLSEGYRVVGFDIERHDYGTGGYPGSLVIQDVLTLVGSQFREAAVIVASPPCQAYSYRAMPWKRAKALPPPDNTLFEACFRIQREASEAASRHIPLIVENVRGAQKWVGQARWHFGSYYLWGDVPALMPPVRMAKLKTTGPVSAQQTERHKCHINEMRDALKTVGHLNIRDGHSRTRHLTNQAEHVKVAGLDFNVKGSPGFNVTAAQRYREECKQKGSGAEWFDNGLCRKSSKSDSRKAASAQIAKIPFPLAQHIARVFYPGASSEYTAPSSPEALHSDSCEPRSTPG
jgi:hypothetical protein